MWFNLAAAQGSAAALDNRDQLARMMTPAQVAEAQRLAEESAPAGSVPALSFATGKTEKGASIPTRPLTQLFQQMFTDR